MLPNLNIAIASSRYFLIEAFLQSLGVTRLIDLVIFRVLLKNNRNRSVTLHISSVPELIAKVRIVRHYVVTLAKKVANMANMANKSTSKMGGALTSKMGGALTSKWVL